MICCKWCAICTKCNASQLALHYTINFYFLNFQFKQNCLNWVKNSWHIIVHISTIICNKRRAMCTKRNANQFALYLSKIAILTLQIASKGCNFNVNIYSVTRAGSCYAIRIVFYFLFSCSNKTVWTGLKFVRISLCILAWWYPANAVQFARSVTQTGLRYTCQKKWFICW